MRKTVTYSSIYSALYAVFLHFVAKIPLAFIGGSKAASFGLGQCLAPMIGFFGYSSAGFMVYGIRTGIALMYLPSLITLTYHLPTFAGTLYLTTNSIKSNSRKSGQQLKSGQQMDKQNLENSENHHWFSNWLLNLRNLSKSSLLNSSLFMAALILVCISSFLLHPVGALSWCYTLYWLPPLMLCFLNARSIFLKALASTLTTHAVGSTLWLYTHQTDPLFWHALIGIVWLERLIFALLMTASYYGIVGIQQYIKKTGSLSAIIRSFRSAS